MSQRFLSIPTCSSCGLELRPPAISHMSAPSWKQILQPQSNLQMTTTSSLVWALLVMTTILETISKNHLDKPQSHQSLTVLSFKVICCTALDNLYTSISALLTMPKSLIVWITTNWKILKEMGIPDHLTCLLRYLYAGQEATVRTGHGTTDWFQIGKGVRQGGVLSPCLFNLYAEYIMRHAGLEEAHAGWNQDCWEKY